MDAAALEAERRRYQYALAEAVRHGVWLAENDLGHAERMEEAVEEAQRDFEDAIPEEAEELGQAAALMKVTAPLALRQPTEVIKEKTGIVRISHARQIMAAKRSSRRPLAIARSRRAGPRPRGRRPRRTGTSSRGSPSREPGAGADDDPPAAEDVALGAAA